MPTRFWSQLELFSAHAQLDRPVSAHSREFLEFTHASEVEQFLRRKLWQLFITLLTSQTGATPSECPLSGIQFRVLKFRFVVGT